MTVLSDLSLEGRTSIVTGAGRGIGREIALVLAEAGADIVASARTKTEIEVTASEVRAFGRQAIAVTADVSNSRDVDRLVDQTLKHFEKIDIMVNNAGQLNRLAAVPLPDVTFDPPLVTRRSDSRTTDKEWQQIIDTNLNGVFYCCRSVAPHMIEKRYGKIINISSNNATMAFPLVAAYNASKAAVNMLTRVLALEWADYNICVNAIGPGDYDTDMTHGSWIDPVLRESRLDRIPLHREGPLRDLGLLAVYLASPASDYMTGQTIYVDGGLTAK